MTIDQLNAIAHGSIIVGIVWLIRRVRHLNARINGYEISIVHEVEE